MSTLAMGVSMTLIRAPVGLAAGSVLAIAVCSTSKIEFGTVENVAVVATVGVGGMMGGISTGAICDWRIAIEKEMCQEPLQLASK